MLHGQPLKEVQALGANVAEGDGLASEADYPQCGNHWGRSPARARPSTAASVASFTPVRIPAVFHVNSDFVRVIKALAQPENIMCHPQAGLPS